MGQSKPFRPIALIVEDDALQREILSALLEDGDYIVIEHEKAEAAEAALNEHGARIALLFVDVNLAGRMSGVELAFKAQQHNPDIDIIITSGRPVIERLPDRAKFWPKPWARFDLLREATKLHPAPA